MTAFNRRELLQLAMALALGGGTARAASPQWRAEALARACRAAYPQLSVPAGRQRQWRAASPAALPVLLQRQMGADFHHGRVLTVAGWQLSETECLFALWLEGEDAQQS